MAQSSTVEAKMTSKYRQEFEEIEHIGKGAFGSVYKCKNKLDGKLYAMKKVKLKDSKDALNRAETEVKALANLQHKAIVRYHTAWMEERLECAESGTDEEGTYSTETFESTDDDKVDEHWLVERQDGTHEHRTLFIQMELCGTTLKDWMWERNQSCSSEDDFLVCLKSGECLTIFKQILQAVECIHDQNVIHRDLKPQNVFMLENKQVKIGDFGLATPDIFCVDPPSATRPFDISVKRSRHTSGVGTPTYAAPEQLHDSNYTSKSDMYSLGVILFELYQKFDTEMERGKILGNLRDGSIPDRMNDCWPMLTGYIRKMTNHDPETRPSAKEILADSNLFLSKKQVLAEMKEKEEKYQQRIKKHEASLKKFKRDLNKKKKAVEKMREESGEYAIEVSNLRRLIKLKDSLVVDALQQKALMRFQIDQVKSDLVKQMEAERARDRDEIKRLKKLLSKKNALLRKKDKALKKKDKLIDNLVTGGWGARCEDLDSGSECEQLNNFPNDILVTGVWDERCEDLDNFPNNILGIGGSEEMCDDFDKRCEDLDSGSECEQLNNFPNDILVTGVWDERFEDLDNFPNNILGTGGWEEMCDDFDNLQLVGGFV